MRNLITIMIIVGTLIYYNKGNINTVIKEHNSCVKINNINKNYLKTIKETDFYKDNKKVSINPEWLLNHNEYLIEYSKEKYMNITNRYSPTINFTVSINDKNIQHIVCTNLKEEQKPIFKRNSCIKTIDPISKRKYYYKINKINQFSYDLKGIYFTAEYDSFVKIMANSKSYKELYPNKKLYPINKDLLYINKNSTIIQCPGDIKLKYAIGDCVDGGEIVSVDTASGIYYLNKINNDRGIASEQSIYAENLFFKLKEVKRKNNNQEIYFIDQDLYKKENCQY